VYDVLLSWRLTLTKSSQASLLKTTRVTGTISVLIIIPLMMGTEMVPEMVVFNELAWLLAQGICMCSQNMAVHSHLCELVLDQFNNIISSSGMYFDWFQPITYCNKI
jgi:hypothetical protein